MSDKRNYILAVDAGLTNSKAIVYDDSGNILMESSATTPVESGPDGISQINMDELWRVVCGLISEVSGKLAGYGSIVCIGFSGHGNGLYCIDASGKPVGKAVTSMDLRAAEELMSLDPDNAEFIRNKSMQQLWSGQPGMILRWMKKTVPEQYSRISKFMLCKDYLAYRLTARVATDYSDISASGLMDNHAGCYDNELLIRLGIPEMINALPECIRGYDIRGTVSSQGANDTGLAEKIPVIGGMFDVDACAYGCGAISPGDLCSIAGTWNINSLVSASRSYSDKIRQCIIRTDGNKSLIIDSSATSAINITWYLKKLKNLGQSDFDRFDADIAEYCYSLDSPYFMPFVNGSLGTGLNKAVFTGIDLSCGPDNLFAAVYEGVCFAHRWHLENIDSSNLTRVLTLTGGAAKGKQFCQLFADINGREVRTVNIAQSGAFGIWAAAAYAAGYFASMEQAVESKLDVVNRFVPDIDRHELFNNRYNNFKELIKCHL